MANISGRCGRPGEGGGRSSAGKIERTLKWWDLFKIRLHFGAVFENLDIFIWKYETCGQSVVPVSPGIAMRRG